MMQHCYHGVTIVSTQYTPSLLIALFLVAKRVNNKQWVCGNGHTMAIIWTIGPLHTQEIGCALALANCNCLNGVTIFSTQYTPSLLIALFLVAKRVNNKQWVCGNCHTMAIIWTIGPLHTQEIGCALALANCNCLNFCHRRTGRQTGGKWRIGAHRAICTGGLKKTVIVECLQTRTCRTIGPLLSQRFLLASAKAQPGGILPYDTYR